ncbi:MAG: TRAP transporter large permease, partial [Firmicutes bacterium]|nr:TRAP transporter large permease [Bacillota bacterium]
LISAVSYRRDFTPEIGLDRLSQVNIVASMLFAGISGSSAADVSSIGAMLIPAMVKEGYDSEFSVSITATSACIGNIIPPSLFMVLLGAITGVSVGGMFLGGFVPGIMIGLGLMVVSYFYCRNRGIPTKPRAGVKELVGAAKDAALAMVTPLIILGGIVFGVVTPTEAGVLAVVYSIILGLFIYKEMTARDLVDILSRSAQSTAVAVIVLATASIFSWIMARESLPVLMTGWIEKVAHTQLVAHLVIIALLLVIGMFMEATSAAIIVIPFLYPIAMHFGIDPVHFGVTATVALIIGLVTPPVGMLLFLTCTIGKTTLKSTLRTLIPQVGVMVLVLVLTVLFPRLVLFLPGLVMR